MLRRFQFTLCQLLAALVWFSMAFGLPCLMFEVFPHLAVMTGVPAGSLRDIGCWSAAWPMCVFLGAAVGTLIRGGSGVLWGAAVGGGVYPVVFGAVTVCELMARFWS
jgi:hypothetical protein